LRCPYTGAGMAGGLNNYTRCLVEYAGALWNPYRKGDIKRLEKFK